MRQCDSRESDILCVALHFGASLMTQIAIQYDDGYLGL